jgi:hypothetical protein
MSQSYNEQLINERKIKAAYDVILILYRLWT